ncbi:MAG: hypothetical protein Q8P05_00360 [Candidatus Diapherotrites archaeon]|nr:hypothetical protein [Candidatus Diapherotrites archaeon]MDZ4256681.1 hypothetical protein [archaeon]
MTQKGGKQPRPGGPGKRPRKPSGKKTSHRQRYERLILEIERIIATKPGAIEEKWARIKQDALDRKLPMGAYDLPLTLRRMEVPRDEARVLLYHYHLTRAKYHRKYAENKMTAAILTLYDMRRFDAM